MANGPSKEEAMKELARREIARREASRTGQDPAKLEQTGFIRNRPGAVSRAKGALIGKAPEIGQVAGGIIGALVGGRVAAPVRGQVAGATAGRSLGQVIQKGLRGEFQDLTTAQKKQAGRDLLGTAATTAAVETVTGGIGKMLSGAGKGALEGLLGPRVAQRGQERGFKQLLDPKFFEGRVPKKIAEKTRMFFDKLEGVTGRGVERSVRAKSALGTKVKVAPIQARANEALKRQMTDNIEDIFPPNTSTTQIKKVKMAKNMIDRIKQDDLSLLSTWKLRVNLDKIRFSGSYSDDVSRYLDDLRGSLNEPLTRLPSIKQAFGRYSAVKELEKDLGNQFKATLIDDEIFTPRTEQFANNLLGTSKDETIRQLKKLDSLLGSSDRVIEDLLDVAATESLDKPLQNIGVGQRMVTEALGGRKTLAGFGAAAQSPGGRALRGALRSGTPTAITSGLQGQQQR